MSLEDALTFEEPASCETQPIGRHASEAVVLNGATHQDHSVEQPVAVDGRSLEHETLPQRRQPWFSRIAVALTGGGMLRKSAVALVDQGIVSAVSFLTMVFLRRWSGGSEQSLNEELGLYQLGFSLVLAVTCLQNAMISTPYAVFGNRLQDRERKQYAGSTLIHQGLLSLLLMVVFALVGLTLAYRFGFNGFEDVSLVLAAAIPFILTREFVRRLAFVHLQVFVVLMLDIAVAVLQMGFLLALKLTGHLNTVTTFCAIGAACAIAGLTALVLLRDCFAFRRNHWADLHMNWSFGKWAFAAQLVYLAVAYCPSWMLAFLAGTEATGRFAMSFSLILIANPVLIGLYNFLGPQAIHAYNNQGLPALRRLTVRIGLMVFAIVGVLYGILLVFGGTLLVAFFGAKLHGQETVVSILAFGMLAYGMAISAENGLVALNRPAAMLWANLIGLTVLIAAGCFLIPADGIVGAALASLAGSLVTAAVKIYWFYRVSRDVHAMGESS